MQFIDAAGLNRFYRDNSASYQCTTLTSVCMFGPASAGGRGTL